MSLTKGLQKVVDPILKTPIIRLPAARRRRKKAKPKQPDL
jgi:hypothetical protein